MDISPNDIHVCMGKSKGAYSDTLENKLYYNVREIF